MLDTCEHLSGVTKKTDCKTEAESQAVLQEMYVQTKIQTEFWNSKAFLRNGKQMESSFVTSEVQLNTAVF